jgi:predicted permease
MTALRTPFCDTLLKDMRLALRMMAKNRGFTVVAILSIALGVCGNTTIFSAINALMFRPLPYANGERLIAISNRNLKQRANTQGISTGDLANWRKQSAVLDQIEATSSFVSKSVLVGSGEGERVGIQYVTAGLFRSLGVKPMLGRLPDENDALPTNLSNVVLSYAYWHRRFANDTQIVGKNLFLDTATVTVIGVLSPGFDLLGTGDADVYEPLATEGAATTEMADRWLMGVARLKPGVTIEQAQSSMDVVARRLELAYPATNKNLGISLSPLRTGLYGATEQALYPLLATVAFVLLIACSNVATLMLSRASSRRTEMNIRYAVGASRYRIIRQMLTESILLAFGGGALGLFLAWGGTAAFPVLAGQSYPQAKQISIDARVLLFTLAISIASGIIFGLAPALQTSKTDLSRSLRERGRNSSGGARHRARSLFVVIEIALALALLVSAGLMLDTFLHVRHAAPGFQVDHILTLEFRLTGSQYLDATSLEKTGFNIVTPQVQMFCRRVLEHGKALPGVESAALIDWLPMSDRMDSPERVFNIVGQTTLQSGEKPIALYSAISPEYFRVMRIPLLRGRWPAEQDTYSTPWVVVINDSMARKFWPNQDPIGRMIMLETVPGEERPRKIIGVVGDVRQYTSRIDPGPEIYAPYLQQPMQTPSMFTETRLHKSLVVRTSGDPGSLAENLRRTVSDMDRASPVFGVSNLSTVVLNSTMDERFFAQLLGGFAVVALLLSAIGIYGVISHSVIERNHEIGVRLALGAQAKQIVWMMLREALILSLLGVAIGLAVSFVTASMIATSLYGVRPYDPLTLSLVSLILVGVTLSSSYLPGRRATRVDPLVALRHE